MHQAIPTFALPLLCGDDEPKVDLGGLLHALYDRAGYDLRLDYRADAEPPSTERAPPGPMNCGAADAHARLMNTHPDGWYNEKSVQQ